MRMTRAVARDVSARGGGAAGGTRRRGQPGPLSRVVPWLRTQPSARRLSRTGRPTKPSRGARAGGSG